MVVGTEFFFSSRRRHTRCLSDWSSDVCSSDLGSFGAGSAGSAGASSDTARSREPVRSEERRVGKGWGKGGSSDTFIKGIITTVRATIQRINIISSRERRGDKSGRTGDQQRKRR